MPKQPPKKKQAGLGLRAKKRLRRFGLCLALLGVCAALSLTVLFPVTGVALEGQTRYAPGEFMRAMALDTVRVNLFRADKERLAALAEKGLPYVHITKVSRQLPGTLRLRVEEYPPFLAQNQDGLWWLIAENGKLLEQAQELPEGVLTLAGPALAKPQAGLYAQWDNALTKPGSLNALLGALRESALWPSVTGLRIGSRDLPDVIYDHRIRLCFRLAMPGEEFPSLQDQLLTAEQALKHQDEQYPGFRGILDLGVRDNTPLTPQWGEWEP